MKPMNRNTIAAINSALLFISDRQYESPEIRPWQYVQMCYEKVGLMPPARVPDFESIDDAEIWMCLDSRYNIRLRESQRPQAV